MGWADDMYNMGYTEEHGGLMHDSWYDKGNNNNKKKMQVKISKHGQNWNQNERLLVVENYSKGQPVNQIAEEFNRSSYAIAWQLFNMGEIDMEQREYFNRRKKNEY